MKQLIQHLQTGDTFLQEIPIPQVQNGCVLIKTSRSLVSLGTEKMLIEFGKANYFENKLNTSHDTPYKNVGLCHEGT